MKYLNLLMVITLLGACLCVAESQNASVPTVQKKWAVIIALDKYSEGLGNLNVSVRDAERLYSILTNPKGANFDKSNVFVAFSHASPPDRVLTIDELLNTQERLIVSNKLFEKGDLLPRTWNASRKDLSLLLKEFKDLVMREQLREAEEGDKSAKVEHLIHFFYIGHGALGSKDKKTVYLCPSDAQFAGTNSKYVNEETALEFDDFLSLMNFNTSVFMSLESCQGTGKNMLPGEVGQYIVSKLSGFVSENPISTTFISSSQGNELSSQDFTAISSENSPRSFSRLESGVYSYFLMRALSGAADMNVDGKIMPNELSNYLMTHVQRFTTLASMRSQTPFFVNQGAKPLFDSPLTTGISVDTIPSGAQVRLRAGLASAQGYSGPSPLLPSNVPFLTLTDKDRSPGFAYLSEIDSVLGWTDKYNLELVSPTGHKLDINLRELDFSGTLVVQVTFPQTHRKAQFINVLIQHPTCGEILLKVPNDVTSIDLTDWDNRVLYNGKEPATQKPTIRLSTRSKGDLNISWTEPLYQVEEVDSEFYKASRAKEVHLLFNEQDNVEATVTFQTVGSKVPLERSFTINYSVGEYDRSSREIKLVRKND